MNVAFLYFLGAWEVAQKDEYQLEKNTVRAYCVWRMVYKNIGNNLQITNIK